jgi:hypothetical protein
VVAVPEFDADRTSAFGRKPFKLLYFQGRIPARHPVTELLPHSERTTEGPAWHRVGRGRSRSEFSLRNIFPEILPVSSTRVGLDCCAEYSTGRTLTGGYPVFIRWRAGRCEIFREAFRRVALCDPLPVGSSGDTNSLSSPPQAARSGRLPAWCARVRPDHPSGCAVRAPATSLIPRLSLPFASLLVAARGHASFARESFA